MNGFLPQLVTPYFDIRTFAFTCTLTDRLLLQSDPNRVYLQICFANSAALANATIGIDGTGTTNARWLLPSQNFYEQWWEKSGSLAGQEWHAVGAAGGEVLSVVAVAYRPTNGRVKRANTNTPQQQLFQRRGSRR